MNGRKRFSRNHASREKRTSIPMTIAIAFFSALAAGILLLIVFAFFLYRSSDPTPYSAALSLVALYLGCFIGGIAAMRKLLDASAYTAAGVSALIFSAIALAITLMRRGSCMNFISTIAYYAGIFAFFLAGAFIGRKRHSKTKARRKRG